MKVGWMEEAKKVDPERQDRRPTSESIKNIHSTQQNKNKMKTQEILSELPMGPEWRDSVTGRKMYAKDREDPR